jgi:hypothetical protein
LKATVTMWFLNIWDNVPMDLKYVCQQYFTYRYMCFLGFIRYNKTFIACGYRKYENFVLARVCRPVPLMFFMNEMSILYIYCMLVREIWKFIHPRVLYSPRIWYSWVNIYLYYKKQQQANN